MSVSLVSTRVVRDVAFESFEYAANIQATSEHLGASHSWPHFFDDGVLYTVLFISIEHVIDACHVFERKQLCANAHAIGIFNRGL